jgi:putative copper resistance protein D
LKLNPAWDFAFLTLLVSTALWYRSEVLARASVSKLRQFLFYLGLGLALVLLVGPLPHLAVKNFTVHMVQHVGLMMLIAPLIVNGSPMKIALNSKSQKIRNLVRKVGRNLLIRQLFRPEVGFLIFLATLISTHFSPLADAGMTNSNIHVLELFMFLIGGFIYYYPVLEGNPKPFQVPYFARVLSLFAMMLPETMTGFFLYSGNKLLHRLPSDMPNMKGMSEQHSGGAIMWAMGMLIDALWIALAVSDWIKNEKEISEKMELND